MKPTGRRWRVVVLALPGVIAFVLGLGGLRGSRQPSKEELIEALILRGNAELDPLSAAHGVAGLEAPGPRAAPPAPAGRTPEELLVAVVERVALVPYEGALASPAQVLESGVGNALDRARLLASLLAQAGHEARVVQVPAGEGATVEPARATPRVEGSVAPELAAALVDRVEALAPRAWSRLSRERAWVAAAERAPVGERSVSWVQVRRAGAWVDLLAPDTRVSADARSRAAPVDLAACGWTVGLRVTNVWTDGTEEEALALRAPAEELHARAVTFTNLPERTLRRFVPTLMAGERRVEGAAFELSPGRDLARQLLHVEVRGPGHVRRATRVLVGPRGLANEPERALEVATLARVLVLTGPVSDAAHADAVERTLAHGAALLRGDDSGWLDAPPLRALNLLRASRALAGRVGEAAPGCLAFQDRPAVAIERAWVVTREAGLERRSGLDLVDPGHAFRGPDAARAAVEQGLLDGQLEHVVLADRDPRSSGAEVARLLRVEATFSAGPPAQVSWSDEVDGAAPTYCFQTRNGGAVGFRLDPGPQVVPLLHDGTGGAWAREADALRIDTTGRAAVESFATMLASTQAAPFAPLMSGLVGYFGRVAEAYRRSASILDGVAAQIAGEGGGFSPEEFAALEAFLRELVPGLVGDIAAGFLAQAGEALALAPALRQLSSVTEFVTPLARGLWEPLVGAAAGRAPSNMRGLLGGARRMFREIAAKAREQQRAGWTPEQTRRFLEERSSRQRPRGDVNGPVVDRDARRG